MIQRRQMTGRQIHHMDIVTHPGTIVGRIVVAEYRQATQFPHCHLGDIGDEVIRDAVRIFADHARGMGADRIKITQRCDAHLWRRHGQILQDLLDHQLGGAIGIGGTAGATRLP